MPASPGQQGLDVANGTPAAPHAPDSVPAVAMAPIPPVDVPASLPPVTLPDAAPETAVPDVSIPSTPRP
jgi:hypothetical protein